MKKIKVMTVFGTRPEAIKMCPLVLELNKHRDIESVVCLTGQHRQMLDQVIDIFKIKVDYNLNIMKPKQTLGTITTSVLESMEDVFLKEKPDLVLVHGDTSTSFSVALGAFYHQIPVGHVEAGLRTFNKYSPFPEEMNRVLTSRIAELHFSPTLQNKLNLEAEGLTKNIFITGNTVIDALATTIRANYRYKNEVLKNIVLTGRRTILMTAHRRENWGEPLENICRAVKRAACQFNDIQIIYPVHLNPVVRDTVYDVLGNISNIHLIDPIDVEDMHNLMSSSFLVLTDSGGLQEEAPSCGVPVLVMRTETERPEAVAAGTVRIVGVDECAVYDSIVEMISNTKTYESMQRAINPYGDGHASKQIVEAILTWGANQVCNG